MDAADKIGAVEIGQCPRNAQHAMIAARGQLHGIGGVAQQRRAGLVELRDLFQYRAGHLRVCARSRQAERGIAPGLNVSGMGDARGDLLRCLPMVAAG